MAAATLLTGHATVLYTFYPPAIAHWGYYLGAALLIIGSLPWVLSMVMMSTEWKKANPGKPIPLAMFGTTMNALLWLLTIVGVVIEVVFQLLPAAFGLVDTIDVGLARTLFAWTLHPIVYFWLIPAYIALYTLMPKAAGGRLFSDEMGRVVFIMLLVFGLPIGFHHLYMDPFQAEGWKLLHAFGTFMVAIPTFITGFTIIASMEVAGRMRGGTGLFGWIAKVDYSKPLVLASGLGLLVLALGGFGGVVNASYQLNVAVHNTMWVPAHFHAIFGGTVALLYFGTIYHLWPSMTGRELASMSLARTQLWLWGIGILVLSVPWHILGLLGAPRRTAYATYGAEHTDPWLMYEHLMVLGGLLLVISAFLLVWNLVRSHGGPVAASREVEYAQAVHPPLSLPKALNGYALWFWITVVYLVVSFGYPIGQFFIMETHDPVLWGW
jgi:cytochrome c oxidase subunit 1